MRLTRGIDTGSIIHQDTVPVYAKEPTALSTALAGDALTPAGRTALQRAQHVVTATDAAMERVFGGGERSAG